MPESQRDTGDRVKVLHIVGSVRTGSTILGNVLGELDGFFHVGELYNLWRNFLRGRLCGCGRILVECPFWSEMHRSRLTALLPDPVDVRRWQQEVLRMRHLPRLLHEPRGSPSRWPPLDAYRSVLALVYREAARVAEARVIIDSSKQLPHAAVAASLDGVEPYFVHLIRNPRGVAYSRQGSRAMKMKQSGSRKVSRRLDLAGDAFQWMKINALTEFLRRNVRHGAFLRLRYEDFVAHPREALRSILDLLGESPVALPRFDDRSIDLAVNHSVGGNSIRFRTRRVRVEPDTRWRAMDRGDRLLAGLVALPLMRRYGYQLGGSVVRGYVEPRTAGRSVEIEQGGKR